jgi:hypothetical protein
MRKISLFAAAAAVIATGLGVWAAAPTNLARALSRKTPRPPGVTQSPLVRYFAPWACGAPNTSPVLGLTMCSRPHAVQATRS